MELYPPLGKMLLDANDNIKERRLYSDHGYDPDFNELESTSLAVGDELRLQVRYNKTRGEFKSKGEFVATLQTPRKEPRRSDPDRHYHWGNMLLGFSLYFWCYSNK